MAKRAALKDEIGVVVEKRSMTPDTAAKGFSNLVSRLPIEGRLLAIQANVVTRPTAVLPCASKSRAPLGLFVVRNIECVRPDKNRASQSRVPGPAPMLESETKSVESAADVETFALADQMSCAELNLLAADAQTEVL